LANQKNKAQRHATLPTGGNNENNVAYHRFADRVRRIWRLPVLPDAELFPFCTAVSNANARARKDGGLHNLWQSNDMP